MGILQTCEDVEIFLKRRKMFAIKYKDAKLNPIIIGIKKNSYQMNIL